MARLKIPKRRSGDTPATLAKQVRAALIKIRTLKDQMLKDRAHLDVQFKRMAQLRRRRRPASAS
jgi:hypothetical protein